MALKLAELTWMRDRIGEWPILLLDEVVAELDARQGVLTGTDRRETLLTTTDMDVFRPRWWIRATIWEVVDGQIDTSHKGEAP